MENVNQFAKNRNWQYWRSESTVNSAPWSLRLLLPSTENVQ